MRLFLLVLLLQHLVVSSVEGWILLLHPYHGNIVNSNNNNNICYETVDTGIISRWCLGHFYQHRPSSSWRRKTVHPTTTTGTTIRRQQRAYTGPLFQSILGTTQQQQQQQQHHISNVHDNVGSNSNSTNQSDNTSIIDDTIFLTPIEIERIHSLVEKRSKARWDGDYITADTLRDQIHIELDTILATKEEATEATADDYDDDQKVMTPSSSLSLPKRRYNYGILLQDRPRSQGGGSTWKVVPTTDYYSDVQNNSNNNNNHNYYDDEEDAYKRLRPAGSTILQLAHTALGIAVESSVRANLNRILYNNNNNATLSIGSSSNNNVTINNNGADRIDDDTLDHHQNQEVTTTLDTIVQQAEERLELLLSDKDSTTSSSSSLRWMIRYELGGRKAADAAWWFALAGTTNQRLLQLLAQVGTIELSRFGQRPSCRRKDIYQIIERFSAAGIQEYEPLQQIAMNCLSHKKDTIDNVVDDNNNNDDNDDDTRPDDEEMTMTPSGRSIQREDDDNTNDVTSENYPSLDLHTDRSLVLIWKFSTKQKKQKAFLNSARKHWERHQARVSNTIRVGNNNNNNNNVDDDDDDSTLSVQNDVVPSVQPSMQSPTMTTTEWNTESKAPTDWYSIFKDPTRPLVIDVGCGMGVSLLGLASSTDESASTQQLSSCLLLGDDGQQGGKNTTNAGGGEDYSQISWSDCNFVGIDLGELGIGYARGTAHRWGIVDRLHFTVDEAENFCRVSLQSYPGEIRLCMIQFPTPYRLATTEGPGNSQLPTSQVDGFMVTKRLLKSIHTELHPTRGKLLLQSNCEDVAVWMRNLACQRDVGFSVILDDDADDGSELTDTIPRGRTPQRTIDWRAMGGERAEGPGWFRRPILHREGATETEVACNLNGTPIHRCILQPRKETQ